MILKKHILFFLFLGFSFSCVAGKSHKADTTGSHEYLTGLSKFIYTKGDSIVPLLDSVKSVLEPYGPSMALAKTYESLGNYYTQRQMFKKALDYYGKLKSIVAVLNNPGLENEYLFNMGTLYDNKGLVDSAEFYYTLCYKRALQENDSLLYPSILANMAGIQFKKNNYDSAIQLSYKAEPYFIKQNNHFRLAVLYNHLGNAYMKIEKYKVADDYYKLALKHDSLTDRVNLTAMILANIAYSYQNQQKYDSALYYYDYLLEITDPVSQPHYYYGMLINVGNLYFDMEDYKNALEYYTKVYQSPLYGEVMNITTAATINLGNILLKLGNYDSAEYFINKGIILAKENKMLEFLRNAYDVKFELDSIQKKWQSVISDLQMKHRLSDSLINEKMMKSIEDMRISKELEKEKAISEYLKKENELKNKLIRKGTTLIIVMALAMIFIIALFIKLYNSNREIKGLSEKLKKRNNEIKKANEQLKKANKELEELNNIKTKFFSAISHDLRSPFNSLLGITEMLQDENFEKTEEEQKEMIAVLRGSIENVYRLLENLLEWSRLQMQGIIPDFQKVDLYETGKQTLDLYALAAKNKEIGLNFDIQKETFVYADKRLLSNTLNNLVNNAIKFTKRGGSVKVFAEKEKDKVKVCVCDTGVGIPKEKLKDIFSVVSDHKTYGTEHEKGSGLGLGLCKEYVELMNGTISIESTEGKGTTVCFTLKAYKE